MVRTGMNKSGQSIREHVRTGLDRPEQSKIGHDMLGWVRTCQEGNSAWQDRTGQVTACQDRIGQVLKPQNILYKPNL